MSTTALYQAHLAAEAAMRDSNYDIDLTRYADAAYRAYNAELDCLRALWTAIPNCDAKFSAETNAVDAYTHMLGKAL